LVLAHFKNIQVLFEELQQVSMFSGDLLKIKSEMLLKEMQMKRCVKQNLEEI
jgi:hypothetical protein